MKKATPRTKTARNPGPVGRVRKFNEAPHGRSASAGKRSFSGGKRGGRAPFGRAKADFDEGFSKTRRPQQDAIPMDEEDSGDSTVDRILRAARSAAKASPRSAAARRNEEMAERPVGKTSGRTRAGRDSDQPTERAGAKSAGRTRAGRDSDQPTKRAGAKSTGRTRAGRDSDQTDEWVGAKSTGRTRAGRDSDRTDERVGAKAAGRTRAGRDSDRTDERVGAKSAGRTTGKGRSSERAGSKNSQERASKPAWRTTLKPAKRTATRTRKVVTDPQAGERLQKVLALAGCGSRRDCEEFIQTGRVMVDNEVVTELGTRVRPDQVLRLDGELVKRPKNLVYFALNKPDNVICTNDDPAGRSRALDFIRERATGLFQVGRLDLHSEGLLLITNDGELGNRLTHPSYEVPKVYRVRVSGTPTQEEISKMNHGLYFEEGLMKTDEVRVRHSYKDGTSMLEITLREGRNREIRRILARIGHNVLELTRISVGSVKLGKLYPGEYRPLTSAEVHSLKKLVGMA